MIMPGGKGGGSLLRGTELHGEYILGTLEVHILTMHVRCPCRVTELHGEYASGIWEVHMLTVHFRCPSRVTVLHGEY